MADKLYCFYLFFITYLIFIERNTDQVSTMEQLLAFIRMKNQLFRENLILFKYNNVGIYSLCQNSTGHENSSELNFHAAAAKMGWENLDAFYGDGYMGLSFDVCDDEILLWEVIVELMLDGQY